MSLKNSNDTIGNRTRDVPTCSAVAQPTALPENGKESSHSARANGMSEWLIANVLRYFLTLKSEPCQT